MTDNTELDRAIEAAADQVYGDLGYAIDDKDRTYASALIAELLRGMERAENEHWDYGFNAALAEVKRIAGIGDEG